MDGIGRLLALKGKAALVTGGARGIGRAVCALLTEAGAQVAVCDLDAKGAEAVAGTLSGARSWACDVSDEVIVTRVVADAAAHFGRLDILIHVAAIFPKREFLTMTAAQWDALHAVNTRGTFLVMRESIGTMRASRNGGAIVNVSSVSGEQAAVIHNSAYGASKAAVTNLTRSMAIEVAGDGIRINAVLPGAVDTEGAEEARLAMKDAALPMGGPMTTAGRLPLGRVAAPEEVAAACLFLASPAASYITGETLAVDGGFLVS